MARAANAAGTLTVLVLVAAVNVDAIGRSVFHAPFRGAVEVVQFSMVLIVFLQLPDVCRVDRLTRSDGFLVLLDKRYPTAARWCARAIDTLAATLMTLIAITSWPEAVDAWQTNDFFGTPGIFTAPWWPVKGMIFFSAVMCALILGLKALTGSRRPELIHLEDGER